MIFCLPYARVARSKMPTYTSFISDRCLQVLSCRKNSFTSPDNFIYLTIRLRARDFYEVIVDEGEARINYHLIEIESE